MRKNELIAGIAEYAEIVKEVTTDYSNLTTVAELRTGLPELDFMDDDEIEDILKYARIKREVKAITKKEYNALSPDYRGVYSDFQGCYPHLKGKRTMVGLDNKHGTVLYIEGASLEFID